MDIRIPPTISGPILPDPVLSAERRSPQLSGDDSDGTQIPPDDPLSPNPDSNPLTERSITVAESAVPDDTAQSQARDFLSKLDSGMKHQFQKQGIDVRRLTPLCKHIGAKGTDEQIWLHFYRHHLLSKCL